MANSWVGLCAGEDTGTVRNGDAANALKGAKLLSSTLAMIQITVNVCKPGMARGNHWHHTRAEKFLVVSGSGVIKFRRIDTDDVLEYPVSAKKHVAVDIPVGYMHSIENTGKTDLVTLMWASENCTGTESDIVTPEAEQP